MTFEVRETSTYSGQPFELYLFQSGTKSWRITSGDVQRVYRGDVYTPESVLRTEIDQNQEANSGGITVTIPRMHDLALRFLSYIPTTPVSLVIYRGHHGDPDSEVVPNFTGQVSKAEFKDECVLSVSSEAELLRKRVPTQRYQNQCNWCLFSSGCGVDNNAFQITGTITSVDAETIKSPAFAEKTDGWLNAGYFQHGTDLRMILSHVGDTITLIAGISGVEVGDSFDAFAGCDRTRMTCKNKFNNLTRFRGFDKIPYKNPFDGGLI